MTRLLLLALSIGFLLIAGCIPHPTAPVTDLSPIKNQGKNYLVVKGDTLHAISFRTGIDYKNLAAWNNLKDPYRIFIGDTIRLSAASSAVALNNSQVASSTTQKPMAKPQTKLASRPLPVTALPLKVRKWQWPSKGKLTQTYSKSKSRFGIQIKAARNTPVNSAASGQVVYAGSAIKGYGKLVIVKHTPVFISAYAHNDRIVVKEGDVVSAGQLLAGMGSSGAKGVKLHFEIRKNGNPVNPLRYLPLKRG